jgi:hypothetical protein
MTSPDRPWDDLHHRSYFLPKLRRIEASEFTPTMNGDKACPINPLATHVFYVEENMETISKMIPIDVSRNRATLFLFNQIITRFDVPREIVTMQLLALKVTL